MLEELYVVLEINRDGTVRSLGHYSGANSKLFTVIVGEVGRSWKRILRRPSGMAAVPSKLFL
jgi:hypothetical protein